MAARLASLLSVASLAAAGASPAAERVAAVTSLPGFVALWDFVAREPDGARRFIAHRPPGETNNFALDPANYVREFWGAGREATMADFPLLGHGPFGQAIRLRAETDKDFRPLLQVPRARLHDSGLDVKGPGRSVTLVAWALRESGNHALAGIWHEGTDLGGAAKVQRGMRQYALFAGLQYPGAVASHISENGASSFGDIYAHHKSTAPGAIKAAQPGADPGRVWSTVALVFDNDRDEVTSWLDGVAADRWLTTFGGFDQHLLNAWRHDPRVKPEQWYNPPEGTPVKVTVERATDAERVELREFRYTRVRVTLKPDGAGGWTEAARDLAAVRLNPWWFPYDLYSPPSPAQGGPFTIGRVVHTGRSVGFTGWLGGVAVFGRALSAEELRGLAKIGDSILNSDGGA